MTSAAGGAGRTTLATVLGGAIARLEIPALVIDMDPSNRLGLMLGAGMRPETGVATAIRSGHDLGELALMTADKVRLIGFGHSTASDRADIESRLRATPGWLGRQLAKIDLPRETVVLVDTPRRPSLFAEEAFAAADCVIDVLTPTPIAYAGLADATLGPKVLRILNGFDATRSLHADLQAVFVEELGESLAPFAIHRDEAIAESLAADTTLFDFSRSSQGVRDVEVLARWLVSEWNPS